MLSNKSKFVSVLIAMMLVLALTIPVLAQDEIEPIEDPVETPVAETSSKFLEHPIVKLLAEFFASFFNPVEEEPAPEEVEEAVEEGDPQVLPPAEGELNGDADTPLGEEPAAIVPAEKIASMHEDDKLGFGVIAKLIGVVQCAEGAVTLDDLVAEFKGGIGVGKLYELYCKPENVGIGQIRKELNQNEKTNNGKGKNK